MSTVPQGKPALNRIEQSKAKKSQVVCTEQHSEKKHQPRAGWTREEPGKEDKGEKNRWQRRLDIKKIRMVAVVSSLSKF